MHFGDIMNVLQWSFLYISSDVRVSLGYMPRNRITRIEDKSHRRLSEKTSH